MQIDAEIFSQYLNHTRIFQILFCSVLAVQLLLGFHRQLGYFQTTPARVYGPPPRLLGRLTLPTLTSGQFILFGMVLIVSLVCAALSFVPRLFLALALLSYFLYFNPIMSLAYVQRKTNLIPLVLLVLLFAPGTGGPLTQETPQWPLWLIKIGVAQMYFSAAVQKLRHAGWRWCNGRSLRAYLMDHYLWGDSELALKLARLPGVCMALSSVILVFELTFFLILLWPQLTLIYVVVGIAFHLSTALTMRINYLKYLSPVYLVFVFDVERQLRAMWVG